jgi:putative ABC transport system permease protein
MSRIREVFNRLRDRARRERLGAELDEELRFHQSMLERDERTDTISADEAVYRARRRLGNVTSIRESSRDAWGFSWIEDAVQDLRYAARVLRRSPAFSLAVVATLALGIGANTAIFSVVNAVVLRQLPYGDPDRLYSMWTVPTATPAARTPVSYPDLRDWQKDAGDVADIAGYVFDRLEITGPQGVDQARSIMATGNVYTVLRAQPIIGRLPLPEEERLPVVAISHRLWQRRYAGDPRVIGQSVLLNEQRFTIVGVMGRGFHFPSPDIDLWTTMYALAGAPGSSSNSPWLTNRGLRGYRTVARLHPGVTAVAATRQMNVIMDRLGAQYPEDDAATDVALQSIRDDTVGGVQRALWLTLGAAGLVLLLACANVAHLMLARATARTREFAVRRALGAHRGRVVRQLLTESLCLGAIGGMAGLVVAQVGIRLLARLAPADIPRLENVSLDLTTVGFAALISLATGALFGLAPTLLASSASHAKLRERGGASGGRLRSLLTSAEVAFALMLLVAAGLMVRSLSSLFAADLGFRPERVVSFNVGFPAARYPDPAVRSPTLERVLARIRGIPGVTAVGASTSLPPNRIQQGNGFAIDGDPAPRPNEQPTAIFVPMTADFLPALGVPLIKGRQFTNADDAAAPRVAIVSRELADSYFRGREPLGRRLQIGDSLWTIVGVVGDVTYEGVGKTRRPTLYVPFAQSSFGSVWVVVRGGTDASALLGPIRDAISAEDGRMNARDLRSMDEVLSETMVRPRFQAWLLATFGGLALVLAAVGIYGVVAYAVSQRTFEIGLRLALGATRGSIMSLILRRGMRPVLVGLVVGVIAALAASRVMTGLLYGVSPTDTITFVGVSFLLLGVALAATFFPAARASRLDPTRAIRSE